MEFLVISLVAVWFGLTLFLAWAVSLAKRTADRNDE